MKEGEPILGGPQANPGATNTPNPGVQPASPIVSQNSVSTPRPTIPPFTRRPQFTSQPQPQPISSNTSDIILSATTSPKTSKSKKWLFILIPCLALMVGIIAFLLTNKPFSSATEENYEEAIDILIEQSSTVSKINDIFLYYNIYEEADTSEFFTEATYNLLDQYSKELNNFSSQYEKLQGFGFPNDIKNSLKDLSEDTKQYSDIVDPEINKLKSIIKAFIDSDYENLEAITNDSNVLVSAKEDLINYSKEYSVIKPILQECEDKTKNCNPELILKYINQINSNTDLLNEIFSMTFDEEKIEFFYQVKENIDEIRNMIEIQNSLNKGEGYEDED